MPTRLSPEALAELSIRASNRWSDFVQRTDALILLDHIAALEEEIRLLRQTLNKGDTNSRNMYGWP